MKETDKATKMVMCSVKELNACKHVTEDYHCSFGEFCQNQETDTNGKGYRSARGTVLDEAKQIINGERQDQYGNPEDSFAVIADFWTTYINARFPNAKIALVGKDTALMMNLFKTAREVYQGKRDNLIDAAGYIGIAGDM